LLTAAAISPFSTNSPPCSAPARPSPPPACTPCAFPISPATTSQIFSPPPPAPEFETRIAAIRADIASGAGRYVRAAAPWTAASVVQPGSIDWIVSQSVLEHIDDLAETYRILTQWLRPGGHASHLIDFDSHGLTTTWNGHWLLNDRIWRALRGRRPYLINREPYAAHQRLAAAAGFTTLLERRNKRFDGPIPADFAPRFRTMSDEDARTRMVLVVSSR
jgi:hypothetical protein